MRGPRKVVQVEEAEARRGCSRGGREHERKEQKGDEPHYSLLSAL